MYFYLSNKRDIIAHYCPDFHDNSFKNRDFIQGGPRICGRYFTKQGLHYKAKKELEGMSKVNSIYIESLYKPIY